MALTKTEYNTIHQQNLRRWVKRGVCQHCHQPSKTDWANKSGQYLRYRRGLRTLSYKHDWLELCKPCHNYYDRTKLGIRFGRPKTKILIAKRPTIGRPKKISIPVRVVSSKDYA